MIPFILGALAVVGISELSKKGKLPKMADGGSTAGLGNNFNIVFEKPNSDIAYKETINANSKEEAENIFSKKHPTCRILNISKEFSKGGDVGDTHTAKFFSKMFQSRDIAHKAHLQTESFAAHKALNEYYDGILPLVDGLVESYQGKYGKVEIPEWKTDTKEPIAYFENLLSYIDENKKTFTDSSLLNQVDEIKALVQSTLYKLKELK